MDISQIAVVQQGNTGTIPPAHGTGMRESHAGFRELLNNQMTPETPLKPYSVQHGDTLTHIVRDALRRQGKSFTNSELYAEVRSLAARNNIVNPDLIHPGQQLDLGSLAMESTEVPSAVPETVSVMAETPKSMPAPPLVPAQKTTEANLHAIGRMSRNLEKVLEEIMRPLQEPTSPEPPTASTPWRHTLDGEARLTSGYGMRTDPFTGQPAFHHGIDLAAKTGTAIHAYQNGTVTFSGWQRGYGRMVIVEHADGSESVYAHCSKAYVKAGQQVSPAMPIAAVGSSGRATGPHLHFELRKHGESCDPVPSLLARLTGASSADPG